PDADPETLADRTLGERNAALLRLRQSLFGDALKSCVECPECGEALEFELSASAFLERAPAAGIGHAMVGDVRVRLPTTRDLASVANEPDESSAARKLLARLCADADCGAARIPVDDLAGALDAADPCMDLALDLSCPACAHQWNSTFDVPAYLWEELDVRARRLLDEVHVLAKSYGWSERDILALPETRRYAYLERVLA
ncbi:MAG TPA: hypothetical protein VFU13_20265, partial [Steroidobacteraceae bacterium]|nr:hypothetical protein [Steroidobacteraceae bacterium]